MAHIFSFLGENVEFVKEVIKMTNKRSTKKVVITSAISILLCFTMLLGMTFAWFTDSVKSENNIIQ